MAPGASQSAELFDVQEFNKDRARKIIFTTVIAKIYQTDFFLLLLLMTNPNLPCTRKIEGAKIKKVKAIKESVAVKSINIVCGVASIDSPNISGLPMYRV